MNVHAILSTRGLRTLFQPIVDLASGGIVGYEALTRGPLGSALESAGSLFAAADGDACRPALERASCSRALERARGGSGMAPISGKLFLNVSPLVLVEPGFLAFLADRAKGAGVHPRTIVVEVTETHSCDLSLLADASAECRTLGFGLAVDDVGAGHSGLKTIAELAPSVVKIDRELVRGVDTHAGRRSAVAGLVTLSRALGSLLVAEGIETPGELLAVRALGVECGQGFLLGAPGERPAEVSTAALELLGTAIRPSPAAHRGRSPIHRRRAGRPSRVVLGMDSR